MYTYLRYNFYCSPEAKNDMIFQEMTEGHTESQAYWLNEIHSYDNHTYFIPCTTGLQESGTAYRI